MNSITSKVLSICIAVISIITLISVEARVEKQIGVLMFSEEARYNEALRGMVDQLKKDGFGKSAVKFTIENAAGSKAKAAELVEKFATAKMNLIFALGTSATIAVARGIKDVPVVFAMVYDPVAAGIAKDWKSSRNNTTGASPNIPMPKLVNTLKEFAPVKRLAVLYTPGEKNSEAQLKELQGVQADYQIKVVPVILSNKGEISQTLSEVLH